MSLTAIGRCGGSTLIESMEIALFGVEYIAFGVVASYWNLSRASNCAICLHRPRSGDLRPVSAAPGEPVTLMLLQCCNFSSLGIHRSRSSTRIRPSLALTLLTMSVYKWNPTGLVRKEALPTFWAPNYGWGRGGHNLADRNFHAIRFDLSDLRCKIVRGTVVLATKTYLCIVVTASTGLHQER